MTDKKQTKEPTAKGTVELTEEALDGAAGGYFKIKLEHKLDQTAVIQKITPSQVFKF